MTDVVAALLLLLLLLLLQQLLLLPFGVDRYAKALKYKNKKHSVCSSVRPTALVVALAWP